MNKDKTRKIHTVLLNIFQLIINLSILGTAWGYTLYAFFDLCWPDILEGPEMLFGLLFLTALFMALVLIVAAVIGIESVFTPVLVLSFILTFKSKSRVTRFVFAIINTVILLLCCVSAVLAGIAVWNISDHQNLIFMVFVAEGIVLPWCLAVFVMHIANFVTTKNESLPDKETGT